MDDPDLVRNRLLIDAFGHWEGDTFVVNVTNFAEDAWMLAEGRVFGQGAMQTCA